VATAPAVAREALVTYYKDRDPAKLQQVDAILARFAGQEEQIHAMLRRAKAAARGRRGGAGCTGGARLGAGGRAGSCARRGGPEPEPAPDRARPVARVTPIYAESHFLNQISRSLTVPPQPVTTGTR
jgi:hypothetical protein